MIEASFVKLVGSAILAPCVSVGIGHKHCMCRLDTGADLTSLPAHMMLEGFELNDDVSRVRGFDGVVHHRDTYRGWIFLDGKDFYLKKILATSGGFGLLGLDVLNRFTLLMEGNVITLE